MTNPACPTCGEPYESPSAKAQFCSNSFHSCRDCTWKDGMVLAQCQGCKDWCEKAVKAFSALRGSR